MSVRRFIWAGLIATAITAAIFVAYLLVPVTAYSDEMIARMQVFACRNDLTEAQKEICYQEHIPPLIDRGLSLERTYSVVQRVLELDPGYQSCHVLAHLVSGKEVAKDPTKWKDVVTRVPLTICGSGAIHGAFQERFREESFPDASTETLGGMLEGVCDIREGWSPTFLDRSSCMHGMGHLFLYVTAADVKKSIALCETLARRPDFDYRQTCYEGVFMQLYQPLEPEDKNLIHDIEPLALKTEEFCSQFRGNVHNACVKESWPAVQGSARDPQKYEALCMQLQTDEAIRYCAAGLMYPVIEVLHYDVPAIKEFCRGLTRDDLKDICWARTATKFVWANNSYTNEALSICRDAPETSKDHCWRELMRYAEGGMQKGSLHSKLLCDGMPEAYRSQCYQWTETSV